MILASRSDQVGDLTVTQVDQVADGRTDAGLVVAVYLAPTGAWSTGAERDGRNAHPLHGVGQPAIGRRIEQDKRVAAPVRVAAKVAFARLVRGRGIDHRIVTALQGVVKQG